MLNTGGTLLIFVLISSFFQSILSKEADELLTAVGDIYKKKVDENVRLHQDLQLANQKLLEAARILEENNALKKKLALVSQNEHLAQQKISELQRAYLLKEQQWMSAEESRRREIQECNSKVSQLSSRIESLTFQLKEEQSLKLEIQQRFTEFKIQLQRKESELQNELERCQQSKGEIYKKINTLEYNISQSSITIQTLELKLRDEEQYKLQIQQQFTEFKIIQEKAKRELKLELERCQASRMEIEQQIRLFQLNVTESSVTIANLASKLESVLKLNIEIQSNFNECEKERQHLERNNELEICKANQLDLENEINDLNIKIENLSITIDKITKISNDDKNEIKRLLVFISECKQDQEDLRACKRNEANNHKVCNENEERLRVEINVLRVKVSDSLQNINSLNVQLQNENQQNIQLQQILAHCKNELSAINIQFQQQSETCQQKYEQCEQEVRQLTMQINQLKIQLPTSQNPKFLTIIIEAKGVIRTVRKVLEKILGYYMQNQIDLKDLERRSIGLLVQAKSRILVYESRLVGWLASSTNVEQGVDKTESRIEELFNLLHLKLKLSDSAKWVAQHSNARLKFVNAYQRELNEFEALFNDLESLRSQQQSNVKRESEKMRINFLQSKLKYHQQELSQLLGALNTPESTNNNNGVRVTESVSANFSSSFSHNSTIEIDLDDVTAESCEDGEECPEHAKKA